MQTHEQRFSVISFTECSGKYFVVHLKMSHGNERRGIMGIKATKVERRGDAIRITEGTNRPAGVPVSAELVPRTGTGWVAYQ